MTGGLALAAYRLVLALLEPVAPLVLRHRLIRGKEDPLRWRERLGVAAAPRPSGALVWLHAASVGEVISTFTLIEHIRQCFPGAGLLLTSGTVTSADIAGARLPLGVLHQAYPLDTPGAVRRFLDHWRPDLMLWFESELWPTMLLAADRRNIPRLLINGRMSQRSFRRWSRLPGAIGQLLAGFDVCLVQSEEDRQRFATLGARDVRTAGNLKEAATPLPVDRAQLARLKSELGDRPCWLAASTHPGEEAMAARLHVALAKACPGLVTIVVPRHPSRGDDVESELKGMGVELSRRSKGEPVGRTGVYLADTLGEMGLWYRLCRIVFVGKSIIGQGGQNPLEPAALDCAILFGPHMENFRAVADQLTAAGGASQAADETALLVAIQELLVSPERVNAQAAAAGAALRSQADVLRSVYQAIEPHLQRLHKKAELV
jgi:3-deoxy-D-manno-octulosonic-acid transferase